MARLIKRVKYFITIIALVLEKDLCAELRITNAKLSGTF